MMPSPFKNPQRTVGGFQIAAERADDLLNHLQSDGIASAQKVDDDFHSDGYTVCLIEISDDELKLAHNSERSFPRS